MIREVVQQYPFIAMDTEFPGVVARPVGDVTAGDYQYKTLKCNVDLLKVGSIYRKGEDDGPFNWKGRMMRPFNWNGDG